MVMKIDSSRHASDIFPLTGKASGKGDSNREGSDVSGRRIDRETVGPATLFGGISTATHVTGGSVGLLDCTSDQVVTTLNER